MKKMGNYKGSWWIANTDIKLTGLLMRKSDGSLELSVDGQFSKKDQSNFLIPEIIHGETSQGKVSLVWNRQTSSGFNSTYHYTDYVAEYLIEGSHLHNTTQAVIDEFSLDFSGLLLWFWNTQAKFERENNQIIIKDTKPQTIKTSLRDKTKIASTTFVSESGSYMHGLDVKIKEMHYLTITLKEKISFEEMLIFSKKLHNFFRFAFRSDMEMSFLKYGKTSKTELPSIVLKNKKETKTRTVPKPFEMLFTYHQISKKYKRILSNWMEDYDLFVPVYSLYFNSFFSENLTYDQAILNAAQALEAFHRRAKSNKVLPKNEFRKKRKEILNSVSQEHRDWLRQKINHTNEPSLRDRLEELQEDFQEVKQILIDDNEFSKKISDYRNHFAHFDPKKKDSPDYNEIDVLLVKCRLLLDACILKKLGLEVDDVSQLLRNKYINELGYKSNPIK